VTVVVGGGGEAAAVISGENGKIAFVSDRDGDEEIYLMDADGGNSVNLTNHPADDRAPAWSPDGLRIAFATNRDGNDEIYVIDADGANLVNLTSHPADDGEPTWSPDGRSIAFTSEGGIFAMDADGTNRLRLTDPATGLAEFPWALGAFDGSPVWSSLPQSSNHRIAFARTFEGATPDESTVIVYTIQAVWWEDTTGVPVPVPVTDGGWSSGGIDWAPDHAYMAVARVDANDTQARVLLVSVSGEVEIPNPGGSSHLVDPAVAPDSSRMAATVSDLSTDPAEIMILNVDGTDPVNLTNHPAWDSQPAWQPLNLISIGLIDPSQGKWYLRDAAGRVTMHYFGIGGDQPFLGDWDCDGVDTSGVYRPSDDTVYLRNSNTTGVGELSFLIDVEGFDPASAGWASRDRGAVLAGDWDGDGCDTIAVFSAGEVFTSNTLPSPGATFTAEQSYRFGDEFSSGRRPFSGDFNGDGKDTVGVQYYFTNAEVYLNYVAPTGPVAPIDQQFWYGTRSDVVFVGDWTGDGIDTVGAFRHDFGTIGPSPINPGAFFFRYANTTGVADRQYFNHFGTYGDEIALIDWDIVSGNFSPRPAT
jgi:WD40 repeat protein